MELNDGQEVRIRIETVTTTSVDVVSIPAPTLDQRKALRSEPTDTPVMYQTWSDLLFLHWEWDPVAIQATLPPGLYVDTYGDKAYVAVTPFSMNAVRASFLPEIPGASNFLELNVRTYVHDRNGVPGVWFYSLDCNHTLAILMARGFYSLPYFSAEISTCEEDGYYRFSCHRQGERDSATFHYRKEDKTVSSQPGTLPFFLTERYLLYSYSKRTKKLYSARVFHPPWDLHQAHVGRCDDTMLRLNKLDPKLRDPDHHWIASPTRVKIYALDQV